MSFKPIRKEALEWMEMHKLVNKTPFESENIQTKDDAHVALIVLCALIAKPEMQATIYTTTVSRAGTDQFPEWIVPLVEHLKASQVTAGGVDPGGSNGKGKGRGKGGKKSAAKSMAAPKKGTQSLPANSLAWRHHIIF